MTPAAPVLRLSVPAATDQIATVRSFAFAVGRQVGLDEEAVEDLKLALSEIAADGIEGGGSMIIVSAKGDPVIELTVEVPDGGPAPADPNVDRAQIVHALFPTARIDRRADAIVTTFSLERG